MEIRAQSLSPAGCVTKARKKMGEVDDRKINSKYFLTQNILINKFLAMFIQSIISIIPYKDQFHIIKVLF